MKTIEMRPSDQTRREFCVNAWQAASFLALGAVFQNCGGGPTGPSSSAPALANAIATVVNGAVVLTVDAASPLSAVGSAALVQTSLGVFLVAHTGQGSFTALTATCTHEACTITGFQSPMYVCPCHGSQFSTSGQVLGGPAPAPLRQFATQFVNNTLTISV